MPAYIRLGYNSPSSPYEPTLCLYSPSTNKERKIAFSFTQSHPEKSQFERCLTANGYKRKWVSVLEKLQLTEPPNVFVPLHVPQFLKADMFPSCNQPLKYHLITLVYKSFNLVHPTSTGNEFFILTCTNFCSNHKSSILYTFSLSIPPL